MAGGKNMFAARTEEESLDKWISFFKYMLFCLNILTWMIGAAMFGICIWMRKDPGLEDFVSKLDLWVFYAGVYVLLVAAIIIMLIAFVGCCSALTENKAALKIYVGTQGLSFILSLAGVAVLLDYSTYQSHVQPLVRTVFHKLIMNSQYEPMNQILNEVQESISCCGADGPYDYISLRRPLPSQCRDSVTGNAYFYGCVDEITWFLVERSAWLAGLGMGVCLMNVVKGVMGVLLIQALRKEEQRT